MGRFSRGLWMPHRQPFSLTGGLGTIVLAHLEEIAYLEETQQPGVMLFLDFEKAFDRLDRAWIERCMSAVGFGPGLRSLHAGTSAHRLSHWSQEWSGQPSLSVATLLNWVAGSPAHMLTALPASWWAAPSVCCTTASSGWYPGNSSDRRVWRKEAGGRGCRSQHIDQRQRRPPAWPHQPHWRMGPMHACSLPCHLPLDTAPRASDTGSSGPAQA